MNYTDIINVIGAVGFPIVAACAMFWLYHETISKLDTTLAQINVTLRFILSKIDEDYNEGKASDPNGS